LEEHATAAPADARPPTPVVDRRSTRSSPRTRRLLYATILAVVLVNLITIRHSPTPIADLQFYASIARAQQLFGIGVPTETWNSPVAIDHLPFYGPVFFTLSTAMLQWLGVTLLSFRIASVLGTTIFIAAAALLAHELNGPGDRALWAVALLVLTPEINVAISVGAMHMLAVGFEMFALAVFVRGLRQRTSLRLLHGTTAGVALAIAAMTTPRAYLFIAAFFATWIMLPLARRPFRRATHWQFVAAAAGLAVPFLVWIRISHGDPMSWARYMAYIFLHEDTDVAILPTAFRYWKFSWRLVVTPVIALLAALLAARGMHRERRDWAARGPGAEFALLTTFVTYVMTVVILNYAFTIGEYFTLPLFAVVVATPLRVFDLSKRTLAVLVALIVACYAGLLALDVARTAATWSASDPSPLNDFVSAHVPPGSAVVGPEAPYFFPVERSGSRFRTVSARSWADWARWVPLIEPGAVRHAARFHDEAPPVDRFFIWPNDTEVPDEYACVAGHVAGAFQPSPTYLYLLGPLGHPVDQGYPETTLYHLPDGCPTGYDPTVGH